MSNWESNRKWEKTTEIEKKYNVDINKDNSKTIIENFGKFAISDCCFMFIVGRSTDHLTKHQ